MEGMSMLFATDGERASDIAGSIIPIVNEYPDVFPPELPGLPQKREIEFCNDLVPEATPILIVPYRIVSVELAELRTQLDDLLDKGFIRSSTSS